jgi:hypothetical protein
MDKKMAKYACTLIYGGFALILSPVILVFVYLSARPSMLQSSWHVLLIFALAGIIVIIAGLMLKRKCRIFGKSMLEFCGE